MTPRSGEGALIETTQVPETGPDYRSAGITHKGLVRATNQDSFLDMSSVRLWVVADGMGGHSDGDVASRMTVDALKSYVSAPSLEDGVDDVRQRVSDVNTTLY